MAIPFAVHSVIGNHYSFNDDLAEPYFMGKNI
jgi:hypothetical protein